MEDGLLDPSLCLKLRVYSHVMRSLVHVDVSNALLPGLSLVLLHSPLFIDRKHCT